MNPGCDGFINIFGEVRDDIKSRANVVGTCYGCRHESGRETDGQCLGI